MSHRVVDEPGCVFDENSAAGANLERDALRLQGHDVYGAAAAASENAMHMDARWGERTVRAAREQSSLREAFLGEICPVPSTPAAPGWRSTAKGWHAAGASAHQQHNFILSHVRHANVSKQASGKLERRIARVAHAEAQGELLRAEGELVLQLEGGVEVGAALWRVSQPQPNERRQRLLHHALRASSAACFRSRTLSTRRGDHLPLQAVSKALLGRLRLHATRAQARPAERHAAAAGTSRLRLKRRKRPPART